MYRRPNRLIILLLGLLLQFSRGFSYRALVLSLRLLLTKGTQDVSLDLDLIKLRRRETAFLQDRFQSRHAQWPGNTDGTHNGIDFHTCQRDMTAMGQK